MANDSSVRYDIPGSERHATVLPKPVPVPCEGAGLSPLDGGRCQVCGVVPFMITNSTMPGHDRRHFPDIELEAIVRDLAAREEPLRWEDTVDGSGETSTCTLCEETIYDDSEAEHAEICVWRRAREWVSAHPVSGDQQ